MRYLIASTTIAFLIISLGSLIDAYGHGFGADQAQSINLEGMEVTVRTVLTPADLTLGEVEDVNMQILFFDTLTDTPLDSVTYRVSIVKDDLLARGLFFDSDGRLDVEIRPVPDCNEPEPFKCSVVSGSEHPTSPGALYVQGAPCNDSNLDTCARPLIRGPLFVDGGLYNIQIDIEGAQSPKAQVDNNNPLTYETFVSIAEEYDFTIQTANAEEIPMVIKTYYDDIENFGFDPADNSITFDMPFDWDPEYVEQVFVVHEEIQVPKEYTAWDVTKFRGFVNGVELSQRVIINDPYSSEEINTVHLILSQSDLRRINETLGENNQERDNMNFRLAPADSAAKNVADFYLVDTETFSMQTPTTVQISWDDTYTGGQIIPFEFAFFDDRGIPIRDIQYKYEVYRVAPESTTQVASFAGDDPGMPGIASLEGIDIQEIQMPREGGQFQIDVQVLGTGLDYDQTFAGIGSALIELPQLDPSSIPASDDADIPEWIKTSLSFWVEGAVPDSTFVNAMKFLIENGVIQISYTPSQSGPSSDIPEWIKTSLSFWVEGAVPDSTFVNAMKFLIENGVIQIQS